MHTSNAMSNAPLPSQCLRPRGEGCFFKGAWSDPAVLEQLQRFRHVSLAAAADGWLEGGMDRDGVPVRMAM